MTWVMEELNKSCMISISRNQSKERETEREQQHDGRAGAKKVKQQKKRH
jgi:hypothetical protein